MSEKKLQLQARFDRTLVREDNKSVRYLVVEATAPPPEQEEREMPPLNLGVVIDASGSMAGHDGGGVSGLDISRLAAAQQASEGIVQNLTERDTLSLISFADDTIAHLSALGLSEEGKRTASTAIRELETRGCTNLHDGWLGGAEQVALYMEQHPECINRLLVLTDGQANEGVVDPDELARIAADLRTRGISTSTVGIGQDYSTDQIEQMAEHGGGMLHHTERPSDIIEVVLAELKDMRATVIDDLEVGVSLEGEDGRRVCVEVVGIAERHDGVGAQAVLGSLVGNAVRRAVFRVHVPAGCEDVLRFRVEASWRGEERRETLQSEVMLTPAKDDAVYVEVWDQEACTEAARVWQADVIRQAIDFNRMGDYRQAKRFAKEQMRYFRHYAKRLDEGEELVEKLDRALRRMARPMREGSRKEIGSAMYKHQRGEQDHRVMAAPREWDEYLED
ncbi:MAG TPA: VWA domain-containing protein [Candidatus Handelsmanbacteria bacterium]|nr:VWA domain-containing protein [Candidatus Handelsmanbacteria bacterium]